MEEAEWFMENADAYRMVLMAGLHKAPLNQVGPEGVADFLAIRKSIGYAVPDNQPLAQHGNFTPVQTGKIRKIAGSPFFIGAPSHAGRPFLRLPLCSFLSLRVHTRTKSGSFLSHGLFCRLSCYLLYRMASLFPNPLIPDPRKKENTDFKKIIRIFPK